MRKRRQRDVIVGGIWRADPKLNLQCPALAIVGEVLKWTAFECRHARSGEAVINQLVAIPLVFIADETEEVINDAAAGGGDGDLIRSQANKSWIVMGGFSRSTTFPGDAVDYARR